MAEILMTPDVERAIANARKAFARYELNGRITVCRCQSCVGPEQERSALHRTSSSVSTTCTIMGSRDITFTAPGIVLSRVDRIHQDVDMVTARLSYKFGGAGPVVAKY
jgi:hypothetical protein